MDNPINEIIDKIIGFGDDMNRKNYLLYAVAGIIVLVLILLFFAK